MSNTIKQWIATFFILSLSIFCVYYLIHGNYLMAGIEAAVVFTLLRLLREE